MLVYSIILTWMMILTAGLLRVRGNLGTAFSNRAALPQVSALSGRADRATNNMLENMVLFIGAWAATRSSTSAYVTVGAQLFFVARFVYWPVYLAGIPVIRTGIWLTGVLGIAIMLAAAFS
jgi:uncharacterized MAPEG superfamily protein